MDERLLLVHAHPDDETINQGATMAKYVAQGRHVTLVTCTLGEEGEVLVPDLSHLASDKDDLLGDHRVGELTAAMKELGVTDFRFLGGQGRYRDSGMAWHADGHAVPMETVREDTFWKADLLEAATHLVAIIREVRPQVMVTYDEFGGYGHPDHIQAHRVAMYAAQLAAVPTFKPGLGDAWDIAKIYWGGMSASRMREGIKALREAGDTTTFAELELDSPVWSIFLEDDQLDAVVDGTEFSDRKLAAMRAHATQIQVDGPFFALSNNIGARAWGEEFFRLAKGEKGPVGENGLEDDLFAGLVNSPA
ncbi:MAG TPA: N-acetyl-1-D-myo-inositol-2-amino-2-deoxy-alpha-D-glucopyranoside deacetylase [Nocardioidaceae bacterium]|nr:N-acetyl-1-D-myo-inositol-2-amino-2-deoxy-alpha-D-glucopyranoside deacetylase [Nocardioidaceae bacterium]